MYNYNCIVTLVQEIIEQAVRVKGGMSLWNGMWHGLRNGIIMRNLIYADRFQRNKLN